MVHPPGVVDSGMYDKRTHIHRQVAERLLGVLEDTKKHHWMRAIVHDIADQAKAATERYKQGKPLSQLDGVFVSLKEEMDIKGLETQAGTAFINQGKPATRDSTVAARLRAAGAIIVGHAVMHEIGWE